MTVKKLIEKLSTLPQEMEVFIPSSETEHDVVTIGGVHQGNIIFHHPDFTEEEMEVIKLTEY